MTSAESSVMVAGLLGNQTVANKMLSLAANGDIRQTGTIFLGIAETLNIDSAYKTESASTIPSQDIHDPFTKTLSLEDNVRSFPLSSALFLIPLLKCSFIPITSAFTKP